MRGRSLSCGDRLASLPLHFLLMRSPTWLVANLVETPREKPAATAAAEPGASFQLRAVRVPRPSATILALGEEALPSPLGCLRIDCRALRVTGDPVGPPRNLTKCLARQLVHVGPGHQGNSKPCSRQSMRAKPSQDVDVSLCIFGESDPIHLQGAIRKFDDAELTGPFLLFLPNKN